MTTSTTITEKKHWTEWLGESFGTLIVMWIAAIAAGAFSWWALFGSLNSAASML